MTRMFNPQPMRPDLAALIERARKHVMTPDERAAQRRSWVKGEFMLEHPEMTEAEVDAAMRRALPDLFLGDDRKAAA